MSYWLKCDRCGTYASLGKGKRPSGWSKIGTDEGLDQDAYMPGSVVLSNLDICPRCKNEVMSFLLHRPEGM